MGKYAENMCNYLKKRGYAPKYDHAGIYGIYLGNTLVYIGKSKNMMWRIA